uniref:Uncharacterized protein n=1 Tax=Bradyrhizobium amphicarpaeae TaxID=1404768 RepID=A0A2U8Q0Z9_9BRAD|nr:hypothetical protein CIT40_29110 [Bradyrhizobium amphicarpaeae]
MHGLVGRSAEGALCHKNAGDVSPLSTHKRSSCPGLSRASTFFCIAARGVDGRDRPGHDAAIPMAKTNPRSPARWSAPRAAISPRPPARALVQASS